MAASGMPRWDFHWVAWRATALVKLADYRADGFGHNDTKVWFQLDWSGKRDL